MASPSRLALLAVFISANALGLTACRAPQPTEVEVEVRSISIDPVSRSPVVLLQDHDRKLALPIWIGAGEAQAIAMQMQGVAPPRPLTHDVVKTILDGAGVELQRVVITDLKDNTYFARIHLRAGRKDLDIDSRPSDAIALAVSYHRPIFVATALLKGNGAVDLTRNGASNTASVAGVTVQNLTDELAEYFSLPSGQGVLVAEIQAGSVGDLKRGDVILEIDGEKVAGVGDFEHKLHGSGRVQLSVQRGSERLRVKLGQIK
jgi:hypothetical protein